MIVKQVSNASSIEIRSHEKTDTKHQAIVAFFFRKRKPRNYTSKKIILYIIILFLVGRFSSIN